MDFNQSPLLVIWEATQACDLSCVHCRASAMPGRNPDELTTDEGYRLLDEIRSFGDPLMVFTGGDPLKRPDLFDLIRHSVGLGLRTNVTPSATPLLTASAIDKFKRCGVTRMAISVDGPDAETHDSFRGVPGTFDRAMFALGHARDIALDTQFQTTVTRRNMNKLAQIAERVYEARSRMWSLFFLVVTGRAMADDDLTAEEYEKVFDGQRIRGRRVGQVSDQFGFPLPLGFDWPNGVDRRAWQLLRNGLQPQSLVQGRSASGLDQQDHRFLRQRQPRAGQHPLLQYHPEQPRRGESLQF